MFKYNNNCTFNGILVDNPKSIQVEETTKATFLLKIQDNNNDYILIPCELWSNGAEFFVNNFVKDDKVWVQCTYKTDKWKKDGELRTKNVFRVNTFGKL